MAETKTWLVPVPVVEWDTFIKRVAVVLGGAGRVLPMGVAHESGCPCAGGGHSMVACTCVTVDVRFDYDKVSRAELGEIFPGLK